MVTEDMMMKKEDLYTHAMNAEKMKFAITSSLCANQRFNSLSLSLPSVRSVFGYLPDGSVSMNFCELIELIELT